MISYLKSLSIIVMSIFYMNVGLKHFSDPNWFLYIMPPSLEFIGLELVYISGYFEFLFGDFRFFHLKNGQKSTNVRFRALEGSKSPENGRNEI